MRYKIWEWFLIVNKFVTLAQALITLGSPLPSLLSQNTRYYFTTSFQGVPSIMTGDRFSTINMWTRSHAAYAYSFALQGGESERIHHLNLPMSALALHYFSVCLYIPSDRPQANSRLKTYTEKTTNWKLFICNFVSVCATISFLPDIYWPKIRTMPLINSAFVPWDAFSFHVSAFSLEVKLYITGISWKAFCTVSLSSFKSWLLEQIIIRWPTRLSPT